MRILLEAGMIHKTDDYAQFLKTRFPELWEEAQRMDKAGQKTLTN